MSAEPPAPSPRPLQGAAGPGSAHALARSRAVWALALGQTLGYACMFYIFAGLVLFWTRDLGWAKSTLAAGPMLAILLAAGLAPVMGRLVDRGRGPEAMAGGAVLGALALAGMALVETPGQWLAVWALNGVAQAACLYEVCFAFLIRRLGAAARVAIIRVTLVAGFASTLAFPAFAAVAGAFGWRAAVWGAAVVMLGAVGPLHLWGGLALRRQGVQPTARAAPPDAPPVWRLPAFWLLALVFALVSMNHWMVMSFLVPIFVAQGQSEGLAVFAAACIGPAQVAGRLLLMRWEARVGNSRATLITLGALVLAAALLAASGAGAAVVLAYVALQGAAMGVTTILRPVLIADAMGPDNYGAVAGAIQMPALVAGAVAPMLGALLLEGPGLWALMVASGVFTLAAVAAMQALRAR
jgi:hypothetical protein